MSGPEQRVGLEAGKVADVRVLDGDLASTSREEIPSLPVAMTILGGEVVYSAD